MFQAEGRVSAKAPTQEWILFWKEAGVTGIWCVTEGKTRKIRSEKQGHVRNTRHCSQRHWFIASFGEVASISWAQALFCVWQSRRHSKPMNVSAGQGRTGSILRITVSMGTDHSSTYNGSGPMKWTCHQVAAGLYAGFPQRLALGQGFVLRRWSW